MVIKSLTVTAPVKAAEAPLLMVKSLMATDVPVIAPPVPASSPRLKAPVMPAPKRIAAPAGELVMVATVELFVSVEPPVPKLITSPELLIVPPNLLAALPPKVKPLLSKKVSVPSPKVTRPLLAKFKFCAKVLPVPVMDTE